MQGVTAAFAVGELLAQLRPSGTTAVTAYTAILRTEITLITIVITGGGNVALELYLDDDGTTYDNTTIISNVTKASAGDDIIFQARFAGGGIFVKPGGSIGVKTDTATDPNFSIWGVTQSIADERG